MSSVGDGMKAAYDHSFQSLLAPPGSAPLAPTPGPTVASPGKPAAPGGASSVADRAGKFGGAPLKSTTDSKLGSSAKIASEITAGGVSSLNSAAGTGRQSTTAAKPSVPKMTLRELQANLLLPAADILPFVTFLYAASVFAPNDEVVVVAFNQVSPPPRSTCQASH